MKALAVLALAVPLLLPAVSAADSASQSHRNEQLHYAISYPASWTPFQVTGADFAMRAADRNGFVSITVSNGVITASQQAHAVRFSFGSFGRPVKRPEIVPLQVQGSTGTQGTAMVTSSTGKLSTVYVFLATYQLRNYTVIGVVRNADAPGAQADVAALLTMLRSTAFFP